jgi:hypothetical protein
MKIEKLNALLKGEIMNEEEYNEYRDYIKENLDSLKENLKNVNGYRLALTDEYLSYVYDESNHLEKAFEDVYMICARDVAVKKAKEIAEECRYTLDEDLIENCGISIFCDGEYIEEVEI